MRALRLLLAGVAALRDPRLPARLRVHAASKSADTEAVQKSYIDSLVDEATKILALRERSAT